MLQSMSSSERPHQEVLHPQEADKKEVIRLLIIGFVEVFTAKMGELKRFRAIVIMAGHLACRACKASVPADKVHTARRHL